MRSVCVFSGSNLGVRSEYDGAARGLGAELARRHMKVIYGGASVGLMGSVADAALEHGGEVVGVIPRALVDREIAHPGLSELHTTESMHERKALMAELSDGFVALPGGFGTLDEMAEVLTWTQLGLHAKPCGILDVAGFYESFLAFLDHSVEEGFVRMQHREMLIVDIDAGRLLDGMAGWIPPSVGKWSAGQQGPLD
jgi:uncharacterized protein (TIGR00730 family)